MTHGVRWLLAVLLVAIGSARVASADEFRPAYLQLTERDAETYEVLWKVPALNEDTTLRVAPMFPPGTTDLMPRNGSFAEGTVVARWRVHVPGGLDGKEVAFSDLSIPRIDVLVRVVRADGTEQVARVLPFEPRVVVTATPSAMAVAQTYTVLGIEHILTGVDHLLFVLALLILVRVTRRLLVTITAFTVAHSITLALASLGVVSVPGPPVEACIALSIVFVAWEILRARQGQPGVTQRHPGLLAFTFGLLHGLGFAGALAQVGLPPLSIPLALLFFNVGVELGQVSFIVAVLGALAITRQVAALAPLSAPLWLWRFPPYAIGGLASYWLCERIAAF